MGYTIHALAKRLGITQETIRHYKNLDLLAPEQDTNNGYYYYDDEDALRSLMIRRYRSMGLSIEGIQGAIKGWSIEEELLWLQQRQKNLSKQIELLRYDWNHTGEIRHFVEMTVEKRGMVEIVNWPDDFSGIYLVGKGVADPPEEVVKRWAEAMPYTYLTLRIPKEQLTEPSRKAPYDVQIGLGCIEKYRLELKLPTDAPVQTVPGGLSVRTFIVTDDPFHITPEQLEPLCSYVREHNFRIAHSSTGWLLATDHSARKARYFILIRVRIA